ARSCPRRTRSPPAPPRARRPRRSRPMVTPRRPRSPTTKPGGRVIPGTTKTLASATARRMAWIVPDELEDVVHAATRATLGEAPLATSALIKAVVDRSRRYTSERDRPAADPSGDLAARALFFTIADAMKIAIPLGELAHRGALPVARPLRI